MKKRLLSFVLAACMVFGSAASLPQGTFTDSVGITASADTSDDGFVYNAGTRSSTIIGYTGTKTDITIPATLGGKPVTRIADGAFKGKNIKTVILAASVTGIGYNAFQNCTSMTAFVVSYNNNSLKEIGNYAFDGCTSLTTVSYLGDSKITKIGDYAFRNCKKLGSISLPSTLTSLGVGAFSGCSNLEMVNNLQNTKVDSLDGTFNNCTKLSSISFPSTLKTLGNGAFERGYALTTADLSACTSLKAIGRYAFSGCTALKTVYMPSSLETLDEYAFYDCSKLTGSFMFKNCKSLKSIKKECFTNCEKLTSLYVPSSVTEMAYCSYGFSCKSGTYGFYDCSILLYNSGKAVESAYRKANEYWYKNFPNYFDKCVKFEYLQCANHNYTGKVTTPATCTQMGTTTYTCTICGDSYTKQDISAKGHNWKTMYLWDVKGNDKKCTMKLTCQNDPSHTDSKTVIPTYKVIEAPTTMTSGTGRYYADFGSPWGIKTHDVFIATVTVKWEDPTYTWSSDKSTCTATRTAYDEGLDKNYKETEKTSVIKSEVVKATCEKGGKSRYIANFNNPAFSSQVIEENTSALGHSWGSVTYTWSKDYSTCTAKGVCTRDSSHVITETVKTTAKTKAATCTAIGTKTYTTAKFKNSVFKAQTKTVTLKALGHKMGEWKTTSFNVDKKTAVQTRKCTRGDKTETKTVQNAIVRYAGSDRAETATLIANALKGGNTKTSDTVIIATGFDFHDALAAVPLASAYNAPLLLADRDNLSAKTLAKIMTLKPKNIIVVATTTAKDQNGYDAAIKSNVYKQLSGYKVTKLEGKTYYATAKKVAEKLQNKKGKAPTTVFITTDKNYADALSASPVAAILGAPILYVDPKANLNAATKNYLASIKKSVKNVYIVGGVNAVSTSVEKSVLSVLGKKSSTRFAGSDRYETCIKINKTFAKTLTGKSVCIAKGYNFPDALAGGVFAAQQKAPLFLADKLDNNATISKTQASYLKSKNPNKLYIFGGETAVPAALVKTIAKASV